MIFLVIFNNVRETFLTECRFFMLKIYRDWKIFKVSQNDWCFILNVFVNTFHNYGCKNYALVIGGKFLKQLLSLT